MSDDELVSIIAHGIADAQGDAYAEYSSEFDGYAGKVEAQRATMLDCLNRVVTVLGDGVFDELAADTLLSDVRALVEGFK